MKFTELVRLLEENGFRLIRMRGSICYYGKTGMNKLVRIDFHGAKEIPTGIGHSIEDCIYQAKWGMQEHIERLAEQALPVPQRNPNATIMIHNESESLAA